MATLKIEINTDNAAFGETDAERAVEVGAILTALVKRGAFPDDLDRPLYDTNGDRVGFLKVEI